MSSAEGMQIPEDLRVDYAELRQEAHTLACDERDSSYTRWIMRLIERIARLEAKNEKLIEALEYAYAYMKHEPNLDVEQRIGAALQQAKEQA